MRDVGAYYATQVAGAGIADDTIIASGPHEGMKFYQVGQEMFRSGEAERGIPACMACHGTSGAGNPGPPYPHVGGQQADRPEEHRTTASHNAHRVWRRLLGNKKKNNKTHL